MLEIEQYLQAGDIELRAEDIKILLKEHNNMKQDIKRLKEEYMILQNASDEVEEEKDKEIERLNKRIEDLSIINEEHKILNEMIRKELQQKENIIKEVREYIEGNLENTSQTLRFDENKSYNTALLELKEILDKENNND